LTSVSEVHIASIIRAMMEALQTFVTLVNLYQSILHYSSEDSHPYTHRRDNLKSNQENIS
jgi:hypothetical protein